MSVCVCTRVCTTDIYAFAKPPVLKKVIRILLFSLNNLQN